METYRLKQFCTIVETESLTQAAKLLGISHSGLSKSMGALQSELKVRLFVPKGRGLEVTNEGRELYPRARGILSEINSMISKSIPSNAPTRIGALEIFLNPIADCMGNEPMRLLEKSPGEIELLINKNELDFGVTFIPQSTQGVEHLSIGKIKMGVYAKSGQFESIPFSNIPFVVPFSPSVQAVFHNPLERDGWPDSTVPRIRKFEVNHLDVALKLVKNGQCAIFIPEFIAKDLKLSEIKTPLKAMKLDREVWLAKRAGTVESREFKRIASALRKLIR